MQTVRPKTNYFDIFFQLTKRHILVLFRNKIRVFFLVTAPLIIFAIYIFFLRTMELESVKTIIYNLNDTYHYGLNYDEFEKSIQTIVDSWMLSGIIAISSLTVSLQTNNIIVSDKENGVNRDFASSPVSKNVLITSYFLYNFIVTVFICFIFLLVCFIYLASLGEFVLTVLDFFKIVGIIFYSSLSSVLFTIFICSFIKRDATMGSVITIFSTVVGFLIGAYMPFSMMPEWVGNLCGFFPGTYTCSLLRYAFMSTPIDLMKEQVSAINGANELLNQLFDNFGYNLQFFGIVVNQETQSIALSVFTVLLVVLNLFSAEHTIKVVGGALKRKKK